MFDTYPDILKTNEVADMLGVSKTTTYQLLQSGMIPCRKIGKLWRVRKQAVIDYVQASCDNTADRCAHVR